MSEPSRLLDCKIETSGSLVDQAKDKLRKNYEDNKITSIAMCIEGIQDLVAIKEAIDKTIAELDAEVKLLEEATTLTTVKEYYDSVRDKTMQALERFGHFNKSRFKGRS